MYFVEKTKEIDFFKRFDYMVFIPVFALCIIGLLVVKSAVLTRSDGGNRIMLMQVFGIAIGMVCCFILSRVDYKD